MTDPDEYLDRLCWMIAHTGDRFYPPKETAEECIEAVEADEFDRTDEKIAHSKGWELGQHQRAWQDAVDRFKDMEVRELKPKQRAENYIEGTDLEPIDWSWYEDVVTRHWTEDGE